MTAGNDSRGPREIFDCERVRAYLESYLQGQVPPPEARAIRLHFQRCPGCWNRVVERDPLQIFSPLAEEERDEAYWSGFWPAVRAGIHEADARKAGFLSGLMRPSVAWAAAAALMLVAVLSVARPWIRGSGEVRPEPAPPAERAAGPPAEWHRIIPASGPTLPTVEEVRSPTAQVLSMKVYGEDEAVTEVVLIVDPETEL